jgi:diguanylate cyclase (GGDEF)-like protein
MAKPEEYSPPTHPAAARGVWRRGWVVATAALLAIVGILATVTAARSVAQERSAKSIKAFQASSAQLATTLQLAIQHEQDLIESASGFVLSSPDTSNVGFRHWVSLVHAVARYPELVGLGYTVLVPAAQLPAFASRATQDPVGPLSAGGNFTVVPPGQRAYYCLDRVAASRTPQDAAPAGIDFCVARPGMFATRDSGLASYAPLRVGNVETLAISVPVYRDGAQPTTVAARRAAFLGWVGMAITPATVLDVALRGNPGTAVTFAYRDDISNASFQAGTAPRGSRSLVTQLQPGWTVTTSRAVAGSGIFAAGGDALQLLIAGVVGSLLLGALVFALGTGRVRALRLVTERTAQLRHQALHDALTGLPNRALIMDRVEQLLARNRRHGTVAAAMFIDLDDFKNVNDTLGHQAGDQLLVAVASRLTNALREADTIGRLGGDEFVVLLDGSALDAAPELVAERLLDVMRQPFELADAPMPIIVHISIGLAMGDRATAGELLRDADVALYESKFAGKNRFVVFHPQMHTAVTRRIDLEFDLRSAIADGQFRLVYQPIYTLDELTVIGVEALLRWDHPTRGPIAPDEFIPILEHSGQIQELGRWVLHTACAQMANWHARGDVLDLSVNISGRQLEDDAIITDIRDALDSSGLAAQSLIIEVTETALMHNIEATSSRLGDIKALGVRIAVDDFGTGYSSLAYLRRFPVDCIKIDRQFTNAVTTSPESRALIATLVQLGKDLGLRTLAEGVETADEMDLLRSADVDTAQGFLMARPLAPETLETQLLAPTRAAVRVYDGKRPDGP